MAGIEVANCGQASWRERIRVPHGSAVSMPLAVALTGALAAFSRAAVGIERGVVGGLDREPGQARPVVVAAAGAVAVPDIGADVVVIAARRHEGRAAAPPRQIETERAAIELLGLFDVADAQMDVADAQALRRRRIGRGRRIDLAQDRLDVELLGRHHDQAVLALPALARPVVVDLDAVALGIVEIERLADAVVGGAGDRHAVARDVQDPARMVLPRRHQEGGVIEAGRRRIVRLGVGPVLDFDQRHAAGAEPGDAAGALDAR